MHNRIIVIDGVTYTRQDPLADSDENDAPYVIVRTDRAGVFAGYLQYREGTEAIVTQARRIWYWAGAASLSELALRGPGKPRECKFPAAVPWVELTGVIEVLPVTAKAQAAIAAVAEWSKHGD